MSIGAKLRHLLKMQNEKYAFHKTSARRRHSLRRAGTIWRLISEEFAV
jgi:hypothetical protein